MTAYTSFDFTLPATEASNFRGASSAFDVAPNFNGSAGPRGRWSITGDVELMAGAMWTAHYAGSPDTIVIQFTAPLQTVSTTVADYTLSGPSAPSITSVVWKTGSRSILLNLSGPLFSSNTYTLAIASFKVLTGSNWILPRSGVYNLPNLVVDVIQPLQIDVTGVGIEQIVDVGTPSSTSDGSIVGVGIEQIIDVGVPVANSVLSCIGVGISQSVDVGNDPAAGLFSSATNVGINQLVGIGTSIVIQQQQPAGVGIGQIVDIGSPSADISPITPIGVGIAQGSAVGTPVAIGGPITATGTGISQGTSFGSPTITMPVQDTFGVGINQIIDIGVVIGGLGLTPTQSGIAQPIDVGTPLMNGFPQQDVIGVGISQTVDLGTPRANFVFNFIGVGANQPIDTGISSVDFLNRFRNVGISQPVGVGAPNIDTIINLTGTGIQQGTQFGAPTSLISLTISTRQHTAFLDLDAALQKAFGYGVDGVTPDLMLPISGYIAQMSETQQHQTKVLFENLACAAWVALNIPGTLPNTTDTDAVALGTGVDGANSFLTFTDGVLTLYVPHFIIGDIDQLVDAGVPGIGFLSQTFNVGISQSTSIGAPTISRT